MATLIASTLKGVIRPLAYQGSFVYFHHQQIIRLLEQRLGENHALVFSQPVVDIRKDGFDWYTRRLGLAVPAAQASPEEAAKGRQDLENTLTQVRALAVEMMASPERHQQVTGHILELAASYPDDSCLYLVGGQPVLANWGMAANAAEAAPESLTRLQQQQAEPSPESLTRMAAPPQPSQPAPAQVAVAAETKGRRLPWRWIALALLLLALLLLLGWCGWTRLGGGLVALPQAAADAETQLMRAQQQEYALRQEAAQLEAQLSNKRKQCRPAEPPAEEFEQRLKEAGGQAGDVTVTLIWNNRNDLDLVVVDPSGETIYYSHRRSASGGWLDVDANRQGETTSPVENVFWGKGGAPRGRFQVKVMHFRQYDDDPTPYRVRVQVDGETKVYEGTIGFRPHFGLLGQKPNILDVTEFQR